MADSEGIGIGGIVSAKGALKRFGKKVEKAVERGVVRGALLVQREAVKITPIATGNLRRSSKVFQFGKGFDTKARVVYSAKYAIFVHEILSNYHRPPTQARFLVFALQQNRKKVKQILMQEIRKELSR